MAINTITEWEVELDDGGVVTICKNNDVYGDSYYVLEMGNGGENRDTVWYATKRQAVAAANEYCKQLELIEEQGDQEKPKKREILEYISSTSFKKVKAYMANVAYRNRLSPWLFATSRNFDAYFENFWYTDVLVYWLVKNGKIYSDPFWAHLSKGDRQPWLDSYNRIKNIIEGQQKLLLDRK